MIKSHYACKICGGALCFMLAHHFCFHIEEPGRFAIRRPEQITYTDHLHGEFSEDPARELRIAVGSSHTMANVHGGRMRFAFELFDDEPRPL